MNPFAGRTALVTGGASGIGAALGAALAAAGAQVTIADIDLAGAERVARQINGPSAADGRADEKARRGGRPPATAVHLDVTDREAFVSTVAGVLEAHDRLDFLFNNAGIAVIGNALKTTAADWDRLIDVNIRGIVHGIEAAYPVMVAQTPRGAPPGRGHIINTASIAGLIATPGFTGYAMSKHAVVGLSVSLREEARRYDVRISAACPAIIHTPMAERAMLPGADRPLLGALTKTPTLPSADDCAAAILRGVVRNRGIIPVTATAHLGWRLYRLWPGLLRPATRRLAALLAP